MGGLARYGADLRAPVGPISSRARTWPARGTSTSTAPSGWAGSSSPRSSRVLGPRRAHDERAPHRRRLHRRRGERRCARLRPPGRAAYRADLVRHREPPRRRHPAGRFRVVRGSRSRAAASRDRGVSRRRRRSSARVGRDRGVGRGARGRGIRPARDVGLGPAVGAEADELHALLARDPLGRAFSGLISPVVRCCARPSRVWSQPMPVAPGPNCSHMPGGRSASRATCWSSTRVCSGSTWSRRTVSHDAAAELPGHAERVGCIARLDRAARVALEGVAAQSEVAAHGQEPARDALDRGERVPHVVDRGAIGLRDRLTWVGAPRARRWSGRGRPRRSVPGCPCQVSSSGRSGRSSASPGDASDACRAGELGAERIEMRPPEPFERREPLGGLVDRLGVERVERRVPSARTVAKPASRSTRRCDTAGWLMPNSCCTTRPASPAAISPPASNSTIRRRTGSPRMSSACTLLFFSLLI